MKDGITGRCLCGAVRFRFDDPDIGRPQGFIWTASAPVWGLVDPGLQNCPGQPGPRASG